MGSTPARGTIRRCSDFVFHKFCAILSKSMEEQDRKKLDEVIALSRENNAALHKLVSYHRRATAWRVIYWTIIIGSAIAAYFSIQPYLTSLFDLYSGKDIGKILDSFSSATSSMPR